MTPVNLRSYLNDRRVTSADWNITGMGTGPTGWTGKFKIPEKEYELFLELAHEHVFQKGKACSLLEKHKAQSPILIDLDFRYAAGGPLRRRFNDEQVRAFVAEYADAIAHFFDLTDIELQFFVALKPAPEVETGKDLHKDGVHIICPTLTTIPEIQFAIRGYLLQTGAIERIFGATGMTIQPQDCLDLSVIQRNNWFLYGACKPDKAWYKVEHVYTVPAAVTSVTSETLTEESPDDWTSMELMKLLSLQYGHDEITPLTLRTDDVTVEGEWLQLQQRWGKGSNWAKPKTPTLFGKAAGQEPPTISLDAPAPDADDMIQR